MTTVPILDRVDALEMPGDPDAVAIFGAGTNTFTVLVPDVGSITGTWRTAPARVLASALCSAGNSAGVGLATTLVLWRRPPSGVPVACAVAYSGPGQLVTLQAVVPEGWDWLVTADRAFYVLAASEAPL